MRLSLVFSLLQQLSQLRHQRSARLVWIRLKLFEMSRARTVPRSMFRVRVPRSGSLFEARGSMFGERPFRNHLGATRGREPRTQKLEVRTRTMNTNMEPGTRNQELQRD
jgi:hypothetical protein